ncbi:hypothetical protein MKX01_001708 [Papaver californicum]|nr:hypothetical protein MKX01_001708 [Papaver californicum]
MAQGLAKSENKIKELKYLPDNLKILANKREKEIKPEKLKIKNAIEKENRKQMRIHARNMVCMRKEVANYHQMSHRLDSMVDYFDKEPKQSVVFSVIPTIVESVGSKLVRTMDENEKQFSNAEALAKFKYSSANGNVPVFISEDEKVSDLIQTVADEFTLKVSVGLDYSPEPPTTQKERNYFNDAEVKTSCFNIFSCCAYECFFFIILTTV